MLARKQKMPGGPRNTVTVLSIYATHWPSPTAHDGRRPADPHSTQRANLARDASQWSKWSTPTARDWKGIPQRGVDEHSLPAQAMKRIGETGSRQVVLNPLFVEALQGFPTGWTDCDVSETQSCPPKPNSPSEPSSEE
jgi:DNA (cytosine-5)-methyltransferase 1